MGIEKESELREQKGVRGQNKNIFCEFLVNFSLLDKTERIFYETTSHVFIAPNQHLYFKNSRTRDFVFLSTSATSQKNGICTGQVPNKKIRKNLQKAAYKSGKFFSMYSHEMQRFLFLS